MHSNNGARSSFRSGVFPDRPASPSAYMIGNSSNSLLAPSSTNRSKVAFNVWSASASRLSNLLMTTIVGKFLAIACLSTNRVWGFGPSTASTNSRTPSTMFMILSTSPPKSACPGVSTMLILTNCPVSRSGSVMAVFFARMVIPRSRSKSFESMILTWTL